MDERALRIRLAVIGLSTSVLVAMVGIVTAPHYTVRDPENPAYAAPAISSGSASQVVRDPDNPYWIGAASTDSASGSANSLGLR